VSAAIATISARGPASASSKAGANAPVPDLAERRAANVPFHAAAEDFAAVCAVIRAESPGFTAM
jgi:hypothetical protein